MSADFIYTFLFLGLIIFVVSLMSSESNSQSLASLEQYENYDTAITYKPGAKWDLNDPYIQNTEPAVYEEYVMLNRLIDKTNALLKYAVGLLNSGAIKNQEVLSCVRLFCNRWKGRVQRMEFNAAEDAAVTLDKTDIHMCLRDKSTGILHSDDTAMFVLIHEIAHMSTTKVGHTKDFWENMKYLLVMAREARDPKGQVVLPFYDFEKQPVMYCGKQITGSPDACVQKKECERPY